LERLGGFARYKDVDGDGIGYRTLPGTDHPSAAYFTRGSGHNEKAQYTEKPDDYANNMERLNRKVRDGAFACASAGVGSFGQVKDWHHRLGTTHWAITESRDQLRGEYGLETDYLRLRGFPFSKEVHEFVKAHDRTYVVEQNRDAQMLTC